MALSVLFGAVALFVLFVVHLIPFTHFSTQCQIGTTSTRVQTRSKGHSLLANVSELSCSEPLVQLSLLTPGSSVKVNQTFCKNLATQKFISADADLNDISFTNNPYYPVFDNDYPEPASPQNYFINGSIKVIITNITTNSTSATLEICLFTDFDKYENFVHAGTGWKNYLKDAEQRESLSISNGNDYEVTLNISEPTFAVVAIASSQHINIFNLRVNATGYKISDFSTNSSRVCHLSDDHRKCDFQLLNTSDANERICIVAFEEGTDGAGISHSNISITLPTTAKSYDELPLLGYGLGSGFLAVILVAMIIVCVCCVYNNRKKRKQLQGRQSDTESDNSEVEDDTIGQNQTIPATTPEDTDTTAGTLVIASPINPSRVIKVEARRVIPTELSPTVNTPIQETKTKPSPTPSPKNAPVQEISSTVVDYREEGDTEPAFEPGVPANGQEQ